MEPDERPTYELLGKQVAEARTAMGMTQQHLAGFLGMSRSSIANIEAGRQTISAHTLLRLHGLLGLAFPGLVPDPETRRRTVQARVERLTEENTELRRRISAARDYLNGNEPRAAAHPGSETEEPCVCDTGFTCLAAHPGPEGQE